MGPEPVNLSGTVISITSGGGKGKRRPKHLLVVQGQANGIKAHGRLRKRERVYRIRAGSYDPDNYKIGSTIRFKDINERNGGYWEAVDLDYEPNKKLKAQVDLRGMGGRPSSSGSSSTWHSVEETPYQKRSFSRPQTADLELPMAILDEAMMGITALISTIETTWTYNRLYDEYTNPRPSTRVVDNFIKPYVSGDRGDNRDKVNELTAYRILSRVIKGYGSITIPSFPEEWQIDDAKRDLRNGLDMLTETAFERLKRWAGNQRRR